MKIFWSIFNPSQAGTNLFSALTMGEHAAPHGGGGHGGSGRFIFILLCFLFLGGCCTLTAIPFDRSVVEAIRGESCGQSIPLKSGGSVPNPCTLVRVLSVLDCERADRDTGPCPTPLPNTPTSPPTIVLPAGQQTALANVTETGVALAGMATIQAAKTSVAATATSAVLPIASPTFQPFASPAPRYVPSPVSKPALVKDPANQKLIEDVETEAYVKDQKAKMPAGPIPAARSTPSDLARKLDEFGDTANRVPGAAMSGLAAFAVLVLCIVGTIVGVMEAGHIFHGIHTVWGLLAQPLGGVGALLVILAVLISASAVVGWLVLGALRALGI